MHFVLFFDLLLTMFLLFSSTRYADPRDASVGHLTHAGERPPPLLLCLFHLWHRWCAAVGGATPQPLLLGRGHQNVRRFGRCRATCLDNARVDKEKERK